MIGYELREPHQKKPRASMGSTAGQDWRAWDVGAN
jgi:hypothetical protein